MPNPDKLGANPAGRTDPLDSTAALLRAMRSGESDAGDRLMGRLRPALVRWAHRRLPPGSRSLQDTEDIVQVTLLRAFQGMDGFEPKGPGALLGYARQILLNALRDEARRIARRPLVSELDPAVDWPDHRPSALELAVGSETVERYERALQFLRAEQREAVILRIELEYAYAEIADALGLVSSEAARKMVSRALVRLAEVMRDGE